MATEDPLKNAVYDWLSQRPDYDDIVNAITQIKQLSVMSGVELDEYSTAVLNWVFIAGNLPLDWLEAEVRGKSEREV
jgi:hypothetical protein